VPEVPALQYIMYVYSLSSVSCVPFTAGQDTPEACELEVIAELGTVKDMEGEKGEGAPLADVSPVDEAVLAILLLTIMASELLYVVVIVTLVVGV
jgi:hypothetical protein